MWIAHSNASLDASRQCSGKGTTGCCFESAFILVPFDNNSMTVAALRHVGVSMIVIETIHADVNSEGIYLITAYFE